MPIILALGLKEEDRLEFETSLGYIDKRTRKTECMLPNATLSTVFYYEKYLHLGSGM